MGKFESYPSISILADDDITLYNHNAVTGKISFATLVALIKNRIGLQVDNAPTKNSINLATSGGIYSMIKDEENRAINVETNKANKSTTLAGYGITNAYTKTETNTLLNTKADSATTLSGYGITDAYTKTEVDTALADKVDISSLATVATSGSYNDLSDTPTIPSVAGHIITDGTTIYTQRTNLAFKNCTITDDAQTNTTTVATNGSSITVDSELSTTSTNPVQNTVITNALANKEDTLTFDSTPTESSTNPVTSDGVYTELEETKGIISDAYNSSTTYAVGDYFIHNNILYKVKVACTGITPPNTNYYTATSVSSQISNISTPIEITATGVQFAYRMGKLVYVTIEQTLTNASTGTVIASGLPRPKGILYGSFNTDGNVNVPYIIDVDGTMKVHYPSATISGRVDGTVMYMTP